MSSVGRAVGKVLGVPSAPQQEYKQETVIDSEVQEIPKNEVEVITKQDEQEVTPTVRAEAGRRRRRSLYSGTQSRSLLG
jgi:hypothetical protein